MMSSYVSAALKTSDRCSKCLRLHSEPAMQDCGCDAKWSGSYHIDDVDPDAAQDLEVFVYDAATDGRELIGKSVEI